MSMGGVVTTVDSRGGRQVVLGLKVKVGNLNVNYWTITEIYGLREAIMMMLLAMINGGNLRNWNGGAFAFIGNLFYSLRSLAKRVLREGDL